MAEIRSPIISVYNVSDGKDGNPSIGYELVVDHQVHIGAQMAADDYIEVQLLQSLGTETAPIKELNSTYLQASYTDTTLNDDLVFVFGSGENSHIAKLTCKKTVDEDGNTVGTWHNSDIIISAYVNKVNVDTERVGYSSSTPIVEFDNDHGSLHYKANGIDKLYPDESEATTATLYVNGQAVTSGVGWTWNVLEHQPGQKSCTASIDGNKCTVTAIHETAFKGQVNCIASYAGEKYSRIFEVSRNLQGTEGPQGITYRLVIDRHVHSGAFSEDLDMVVKLVKYTGTQSELVKWDDDTTVVQIQARYATTSGYEFRWIKDESKTSFTLQPALGTDNKTEPWKNEDIFITAQINNELVDEECITYAALNTVTLDLDNDSGSLPYSIDGSQKLFDNAVAQSKAQLYLGENPITSDATYTWTVKGSSNWTTIEDESSKQKQTVQVIEIDAGVDTALATCTVTYKDNTYTKQFPVSKRYQGEQGLPGTDALAYKLIVDTQVHLGSQMAATDKIAVQLRQSIGSAISYMQLNAAMLSAHYETDETSGDENDTAPTDTQNFQWVINTTTPTVAYLCCADGKTWQNLNICIHATVDDIIIDREKIQYSSGTPILTLDNDQDALSYDTDGLNKEDIDQFVACTAALYVGKSPVTAIDGIQYNWAVTNGVDGKWEQKTTEVNNDTIKVYDIDPNAQTLYATCTATYLEQKYTKVFKVVRVLRGKTASAAVGYDLVIDHQVHTGALMTDEFIAVQLTQTVGTTITNLVLNDPDNAITLEAQYAGETGTSLEFEIQSDNITAHLMPVTGQMWHNKDLIIRAYINDVLVDVERLIYSADTPRLDFDNNFDTITYKWDAVNQAYQKQNPDENIVTTALLWLNGKQVTQDVTFAWAIPESMQETDYEVEDATLTLKNIDGFKMSIKCTATYRGMDYINTFVAVRTIAGQDGSTYSLVVDRQVHTGTLMAAGTKFTVRLLRTTGTAATYVDMSAGMLKAYYDGDESTADNFYWDFDNTADYATVCPDNGVQWENKDVIITAIINDVVVASQQISYSSNTPILDLTNDTDILMYDESGTEKIDTRTAKSTAQLYVQGQPVEDNVTYEWTIENGTAVDETPTKIVTGATVEIIAINEDAQAVIATCTAEYDGKTYQKQFTVSKGYQGQQGKPGTSPTVYSLLIDRQVHTGLMMGANDAIQVQVRATTADSTTMIWLTSVDIEIEAKYQTNTAELTIEKPTSESKKTIATIKPKASQSWQNDDIMVSLKIKDSLIDQERISYSGDTPILELTNDVATLLYDSTGTEKVLSDQEAQTTAQLYVRGQVIPTPIKWIINDDPNFEWTEDVKYTGENNETLTVKWITDSDDVLFATASAEWGDMEYSKIFTVYKLCQGKDGEKGETGAASDITQQYIYLYYKLETIQAAEGKAPSIPNNISDIVAELDTDTEGQWAYSKGKWGTDLKTSCVLYRVMMITITKGTDQTPTYTYGTPELYEAYDSTGMLGSQSYLDYLSITNFDNSDSFGYKDGSLYIKSTFINTDGIMVSNAIDELLFAAGGNSDYKNAVKIGGFMVTGTALRNVTGSAGKIGGMNSPTDSLIYAGSDGGGPGLPDTDYIYVGADGIGLIHTSTTYAPSSSNYYATAQTYLKAGKLYSNAGSIAGLSFDDTSIYNIHTSPSVNWDFHMNSPTTFNSESYYAAWSNMSGHDYMYIGSTGFGVLKIKEATTIEAPEIEKQSYLMAGELFSNSAEITGKITATSGQIGGLTLNNTSLYNVINYKDTEYYLIDPKTLSTTVYTADDEYSLVGSNLVYLGPDGLGIASIALNGDTAITIGKYVRIEKGILTTNGLVAINAEITGKITATSGQIGDWGIQDGVLSVNWTGKNASQVDSSGVLTLSKDGIIGTSATGLISSIIIQPGFLTLHSDKLAYPSGYVGLAQSLYLTPNGLDWEVETSGDITQAAYITLQKSTSACTLQVYGQNLYHHVSKSWGCNVAPTVDSDKNVKHAITEMSEDYATLFDNLHAVLFKYNDGASNRFHTGFIAQEVQDALNTSGLTAADFAALCCDNIGTNTEHWGLRYEEFISLNTWQIQLLKPRVSELEARCAQLEARIKQLEEQNEKI